jgi:hypothetical protein
MLFSFIGIVFSALPTERGLRFWGSVPSSSQRPSWLETVEAQPGKLPASLQWRVWSTHLRNLDMSIALYDMLAGLAKGHQYSDLAYNFLARSRLFREACYQPQARAARSHLGPPSSVFSIPGKREKEGQNKPETQRVYAPLLDETG